MPVSSHVKRLAWSFLFFTALVDRGTLARGADEFPAELVRFQDYDGNPVFRGLGGQAWDAKIRERGWITRDGDNWRMWYTGYDGSDKPQMMLGYAISRDGLAWTRHPANPIYREHWVEDMMVVKHGDMYYMFAEGLDD